MVFFWFGDGERRKSLGGEITEEKNPNATHVPKKGGKRRKKRNKRKKKPAAKKKKRRQLTFVENSQWDNERGNLSRGGLLETGWPTKRAQVHGVAGA